MASLATPAHNKDVIEFYDTHGKKKCLECLMDSNHCTVQPTERSYEKSLQKLISQRKVVKRSIDRTGVHHDMNPF